LREKDHSKVAAEFSIGVTACSIVATGWAADESQSDGAE